MKSIELNCIESSLRRGGVFCLIDVVRGRHCSGKRNVK